MSAIWLSLYFCIAPTKTNFLRANDANFWRLWSLADRRMKESTSKGELSVMMVGSSRTQFGFSGQTVEETMRESVDLPVTAVGFGCAGSGPLYQLVLAHRMMELGSPPDLVALEIHPALLMNIKGRPMELNWLNCNRLHPLERDLLLDVGVELPGDLPDEREQASWAKWFHMRQSVFLPLREAFLTFENGGPNELLKYDQWGAPLFKKAKGPVQNGTRIAQARAEYFEALQNHRPGESTLACLAKTIELFAAKGIPLVMVRYPEGPAFRSWYEPGLNEEIVANLNRLAETNQVTLIDAWSWLKEEDFVDSHHMTREGARLFSDKLSRELSKKVAKLTKSVKANGRL